MLNYIWAVLIVGGIIIGGFRGQDIISEITGAALDSAQDAVELCMVMLGVVGLWSGLMNIAKEAGLITKWTGYMEPAISFLFPGIPKGHPVRQDIATNLIANILGLGWAATPAGLAAMKGLAGLNTRQSKGVASDEMCTLLVINISSLQLIPVNIIAYRSQYGSQDPTAVIGPGLMATFITTLVAVIFCRAMCTKNKVYDTMKGNDKRSNERK